MDEPRKNDKAARKTLIRWVKRVLGGLFVAAVVAMLVVAWMPKPVPVDAGDVTRGTLCVTVDEDGRTRVKDRYVVSAPLTGNLARIELDPGDDVEQGDVLARLVPAEAPLLDERTRAQTEAQVAASNARQRQARATIQRVQAALEYAEREAERQRRLAREGSVAPTVAERAELEVRTLREELASARFAARVADHERQMAEAALGRMGRNVAEPTQQLEVPAPVTGKVLRIMREHEGVVQAGTPLLEVGNPQALEIVVDGLTSDAVEIEPGADVSVERWGGERPLEGHVRRIEPSAFTRVSALGVEEQRVNSVIDLETPHEEWQQLGDGYRVEARILVWEEQDVLQVPASALFRHDDGWATYRIAEGVARLSVVEVGRSNGLDTQVLDGLSEGDRVIVHPSDRIEDGIEVTIR